MGKEKGAMPHKNTSRKQIGVDQKEMRRTREKENSKEKGKLFGKNIEKSAETNIEGNIKRNREENIERNTKGNMKENIERNTKGNMKENIERNLKGNMKENIERNLKGNTKGNIKVSGKRIEKRQIHNEKEVQGKKVKRNESICPIVKKCGGCQLLRQSYEQQLKDKQKLVDGLLSKFCKVEKIIGMDNPYHYRNKVHAVFDHDRKGNPISGVYEAGTHRVVPVENCLIENEKADKIIGSIRGLLKSFKIKTYDEDTGYGLLRHVLVRIGYTSGEIMVVLVLGSPIMPSKNNFVKALRKLHPEITTIIINVNNKKTSMVLGEKEQVIYGKGYIEDTLCGKVFRISPKSFYQVNPVQTEVLYNKAIEYAEFTGSETIIDAYCGIGTIGIIASEHVKKIIGVELNKDAVRDAVLNAKRNNIFNIDFYNKDAGEFMSQMAEQDQTVDFVFMDPPRAGSDEKFLSSLCSLNPKKVVYISCNPVTLERDLVFLTKKGYKVQKAVPVDMFPGTEHTETVCMLNRTK